mgnify:CR=1 FL=1
MSDCEVCGRTGARIDCIIESAKLRVCENCSRLGKVVYVERPPVLGKGNKMIKKEFELELVEDYAERIKNARNKLQLNVKELASLILEKESFLDGIEKETTVPTEKTARKLERYLKIKLLEEVPAESSAKGNSKRNADITLGDVVDIKK